MTNSSYDTMMRLPLLGWVLIFGGAQLLGLIQYMDKMSPLPIDAFYVIHLAMRLSTLAFMLLIATAVILRTRPSEKARGLEPRISALAGSLIMYGFFLFPRRDMSLTLEMITTILILTGTIGAVLTLARLGRSFSVMAETRQLVTSGPYRFVRHPLYLTEEIAVIGVFIQFASVWTILLLVVQIAFQLRRMHNEEQVLTASLPEYIVYQQTTARLIPGIY
jgi:protein-S-isoprenylcysteine O-methyltransferase Ste14